MRRCSVRRHCIRPALLLRSTQRLRLVLQARYADKAGKAVACGVHPGRSSRRPNPHAGRLGVFHGIEPAVHARAIAAAPQQGGFGVLKQNPMLTVRATLPIMANGNTIAVRVWFE